MDVLKSLNEKQKEAVLTTEGPVLILAGAGSGKTKTIAHRIAHLIKNGASPKNILAVTFTNKAAHEMRSRIEALLKKTEKRKGLASPTPFVSTFHSLGVYILKQSGRKIGLVKNFSILDEEDALSLIKECLKELEIDPRQFQPTKVRAIISHLKNQGKKPENFVGPEENNFFMKTIDAVWEKYENKLKKQKSLDFDDLIVKTVELFEGHPEILKKYQKKWQYLHIDEYQDTNKSQWLLAGLLAKKHKNICAVGDDDQSIYAFRGADYKNILNFEKEWPKTKIIALEENYRSSQTILNAANALISKNHLRHQKNLFTRKKAGRLLAVFNAENEKEEARFAVEKIKELGGKREPFSSMAVLYRSNFQSRIFEEELLKNSIPYQMLGTKFYERKEIKDILSYLKAARNPNDMLSLKRVINAPGRGIGKILILKFLSKEKNLNPKEKERLKEFQNILTGIKKAVEQKPASEAIGAAVKKSGYDRFLKDGTEEGMMRMLNLKELVSLSKRYDGLKSPLGIEALLADAALASEQDSLNSNKKGVKLMTIHAAKGLEFQTVFLVGLEQGLFPINNSFSPSPSERQKNIEEERRIFYVGLTRAKEDVFLSFASFRTIFGEKRINPPSRFLTEIPEKFLSKKV